MRQRRRTRARGIQSDGFAMESALPADARSAAINLLEESAIRFLLDGLEVESIHELKRLVDIARRFDQGPIFAPRDPDGPVLGHCPHGVDLDRDFCPRGCRV